MNTLAFDRSSVRSIDQDGRLHVEISNISKSAINPYYGKEIPRFEELGLEAEKIYQMFRDPEELEKGAATFNNLPLLSQHVPVSADNPREEIIIGSTGTDAAFKAPYLTNSLVVWSAEYIQKIESEEQKEISCAYRYTPDMTPGKFEGKEYDGVMRGIKGNHVALVAAGRAGADVVVGDAKTITEECIMKKGLYTKAALSKLAQDADIEAVGKLLELLADEAEGPGMGEDEIDLSDATPEQLAAIKKILNPSAEDEFPEKEDDKKEEKKEAEDEEDDKVDKKAMDAAIAQAKAETVKEMRAISEALKVVHPYVGDIIAQDSAEVVYAEALKLMGVDVQGVHPSAYKAVLQAQPKPGDKQEVAMDSAGAKGFYDDFPGAKKIKVARG